MIIKEKPEDFIVEEIPSIIFKKEGEYSIYKLWKRNLNTEEAIEIICKIFKIDRKKIKYAGNKDKHAETTQYISVYKNEKKLDFEIKDLRIEFVGFSDEPLSLGTLKGNNFRIRVKKLKDYELEEFKKKINSSTSSNNDKNNDYNSSDDKNNKFKINNYEFKANNRFKTNNKEFKILFPNYFDEQRFSENNLEIGLDIIKKKFKEAVLKIIESKGKYENEVKEHITKNPNDYVNAIKKVPKKILTIYLHSVQSKIFNETLSRSLKEYALIKNIEYKETKYSQGVFVFFNKSEQYKNFQPERIPLIGFDTIVDNSNRRILEELGITPKDFIIRAIPECSMESSLRESIVCAESFKYEIIKDNLLLEFFLPKGSYATILIKSLI